MYLYNIRVFWPGTQIQLSLGPLILIHTSSDHSRDILGWTWRGCGLRGTLRKRYTLNTRKKMTTTLRSSETGFPHLFWIWTEPFSPELLVKKDKKRKEKYSVLSHYKQNQDRMKKWTSQTWNSPFKALPNICCYEKRIYLLYGRYLQV